MLIATLRGPILIRHAVVGLFLCSAVFRAFQRSTNDEDPGLPPSRPQGSEAASCCLLWTFALWGMSTPICSYFALGG